MLNNKPFYLSVVHSSSFDVVCYFGLLVLTWLTYGLFFPFDSSFVVSVFCFFNLFSIAIVISCDYLIVGAVGLEDVRSNDNVMANNGK